jgi:HAD superfamily hydrolase (TIGR01490 family)
MTLRERHRLAGEASARAASTDAAPAVGVGVEPDATAAAFFDVDNTVVRGASIFYMARGLHRRDLLRLSDILRFAVKQASFILLGENLEHVAQIRERALSFVEGHSVAELTAIGEEVYDEVIARKVWPGAHALARAHLAAGQQVWLVTATPVEVAGVIARRLGLTGALGTVAEHTDGVYTGRLIGEALHGPAKAEAVRALAEREGLDLARCAAYSDSANDIPLLSLVGHPVAVNPDRRLRAHARASGWEVREYRRGRAAARIGVPAATVTGVAAGVVALAIRRAQKRA